VGARGELPVCAAKDGFDECEWLQKTGNAESLRRLSLHAIRTSSPARPLEWEPTSNREFFGDPPLYILGRVIGAWPLERQNANITDVANLRKICGTLPRDFPKAAPRHTVGTQDGSIGERIRDVVMVNTFSDDPYMMVEACAERRNDASSWHGRSSSVEISFGCMQLVHSAHCSNRFGKLTDCVTLMVPARRSSLSCGLFRGRLR
jgi:hypothetical protein